MNTRKKSNVELEEMYDSPFVRGSVFDTTANDYSYSVPRGSRTSVMGSLGLNKSLPQQNGFMGTEDVMSPYTTDGNDPYTTDLPYSDAELANNPSPEWMSWAADNIMAPGLWAGANVAANAIAPGFGGLALGVGKNIYDWATGNEDKAVNSLLGKGLSYGINAATGGGLAGLGGKTLGPLGYFAGNILQGLGIGKFTDFLTGNLLTDNDPYQGPRGWIDRGIDFLTGKYSPDKPTIGNPVTDPFLAVGPGTEDYDGTNMLGDPNYDPYGAVPDGGGLGDFGGGAWGADGNPGWDSGLGF
jgi:hypothetical protein